VLAGRVVLVAVVFMVVLRPRSGEPSITLLERAAALVHMPLELRPEPRHGPHDAPRRELAQRADRPTRDPLADVLELLDLALLSPGGRRRAGGPPPAPPVRVAAACALPTSSPSPRGTAYTGRTTRPSRSASASARPTPCRWCRPSR